MKHLLSIFLMALCLADLIKGDVVVVVNRTAEPIKFTAKSGSSEPKDWSVNSREVITIPMRVQLQLTCATATPAEYQLDANSVYYFDRDEDGPVTLREIDLSADDATRKGRELNHDPPNDAITTIPVKILVDDEEHGRQEIWESRLRKRIEAASAIFSKLFRIQFEVAAVGTWQSDSDPLNFSEAMREFELEVKPQPARIAIGFTGHILLPDGGEQSTVAALPLHSHLLIGDRAPRATEAERFEALIHGLGHWLGAVHSPEPHSAMRINLADGQARRNDFKILIDPINVLIMYLVSEEVRFRGTSELAGVSEGTARRLAQLYETLNEFMSNDVFAVRNRSLLNYERREAPAPLKPAPPPKKEVDVRPRVASTRRVLESMVAAGRINASVPATQKGKLRGDELTAHYLQRAAQTAQDLEPEVGPQAFLFALGIGLDDSDILRGNPLVGEFCRQVESDDERTARIKLIGQPTIRGRRDLAQHFVVSCFLTAMYNRDVAEAAGVAKEILDSQGESGFSFADLAADYAGITFARLILARDVTLVDVGANFVVSDYVPIVNDLPEGLSWEEFAARFGSASDERFLRIREQIEVRISRLPGYRVRSASRPATEWTYAMGLLPLRRDK